MELVQYLLQRPHARAKQSAKIECMPPRFGVGEEGEEGEAVAAKTKAAGVLLDEQMARHRWPQTSPFERLGLCYPLNSLMIKCR